MQRRSVLLSLVILAALGAVVLKWPRGTKAKPTGPAVPTARVQAQSFDVTLRVSGVLDAAKSTPVIIQVPQTQIAWIAEDGGRIKAGDPVVRLNSTQLAKQVTDQEQQHADSTQQERTSGEEADRRVQNAKVALEKAKSDLTLTKSQGVASVERSTAQVKYAEKEAEFAQSDYDRKKRLADEHLLPLTQLESASDQLRAQQFQLETARRDLDKAKHDAEVNAQIRTLDVRKAELELQSAESAAKQTQSEGTRSQADRVVKLQEAHKQLADSEVKASAPGLLLVESMWDGAGERKYRVGDQVNEGRKIASVISEGDMIVSADVGEADIADVRIGQPGLVRVEALGNALLHGKVVAIDNVSRDRPIWEGGTAKRVFSVRLQLTDRETRLRPGMSGTVEIVLERAKGDLSVPAEAVFGAPGAEVVYCQRGDRFAAVRVTVLRRSEMIASVKGALREGDVVARQVPPPDRMVGAKERKS